MAQILLKLTTRDGYKANLLTKNIAQGQSCGSKTKKRPIPANFFHIQKQKGDMPQFGRVHESTYKDIPHSLSNRG